MDINVNVLPSCEDFFCVHFLLHPASVDFLLLWHLNDEAVTLSHDAEDVEAWLLVTYNLVIE